MIHPAEKRPMRRRAPGGPLGLRGPYPKGKAGILRMVLDRLNAQNRASRPKSANLE